MLSLAARHPLLQGTVPGFGLGPRHLLVVPAVLNDKYKRETISASHGSLVVVVGVNRNTRTRR